ncbi:MAG: phycobilisome Linker polypeptide [Symploca sp. SIO2D2]|nr:phycobilisome Linker polypeptide [Symploca sp. SIO2D2]
MELLPASSEGEVETVIRAVYRQVLGNAHVMESERLRVPESQLKRGEISVREFVRQVAKSTLYRSRFFDNCPRYRSMELNFKHLLGRAPDDYSETFSHSQILDQGGFEAEIDSYLDSDEYQEAFGENIVPYYRGYRTQTGKKLLGFTNTFKLYKSLSTSDKAGVEGNQPRLAKPLMYNNPSGIAPVTNIQELIAEALTPKPWMVRKPVEAQPTEAESALQRQYQEQEALLETLHKQLAELRPSAAFGEQTLSKWQTVKEDPQTAPTYSSPLEQLFIEESPQLPSESLEQRIQEQAQEIANLEAKIADSRRLAAFGEAKLGKWQRRSFSIR